MARSALRAAIGEGSPQVLSRDNMPALRRAVRDVLAQSFLRLNGLITATNISAIDPATDDIVTLEIAARPAFESTLLPVLEGLATSGLLALAYGQAGIATNDEADTNRILTTLAALTTVTAPPPRIRRGA